MSLSEGGSSHGRIEPPLPSMPNLEWHKRHDFAEVAEALGIETSSIAGTLVDEGRVVVLFGVADVWGATLERDSEGLLREVGERVRLGSWNEWTRDLERHMFERFGRP